MKLKKMITKHRLNAIVIGFLVSSAPLMAANYNALDHQQDNFSTLDQPHESQVPGSVIQSFQQAEQLHRKSSYIEVVNLLKENKLKEAEAKVSDLLKKNPNEAEFYNLKALIDALNKDVPAAEQSYGKALKLDPSNLLSHLGLAKLALDNRQLDKAKDYANKAVAINGKAINAYLLLADISFLQKDYAAVEKALLTAHEKVKGELAPEIEIIKSLAKFYGTQKQEDKVLGLAEDLDKRYPNTSVVLSLLAQAQIINYKKPLAEATLQKLLKLDKNDLPSQLLLAKLLMEHPEKEKETLALLDAAVQIKPDIPDALVLKAAYLVKLKRIQDALALANKIDQQFPKLVIGKLLKGDAYLADKQLDKATEMYQLAYKLQPNDKVLLTLADLLSAQKKNAEAIKLLEDALAKNPKNLGLHFKLGTLYQQQNDNEKAQAHYVKMLEIQPENVIALNNLAFLYSLTKDPRAIELAKKAYTIAPSSGAIADTYGYILINQGQAKEGLPILEKAAALAPKSNEIKVHLAEAYVANGDTAKALEILEPLSKVEQDFPEKKTAISLLEKLKAH
ncbi:MAG: tetratricopeptide repeat protein [Methylococcales bacterium]|nr:tetratricopeptide repeat protein [Methylococcales bacterium]